MIAAKIMIHNATTFGFVSGNGTARIFTSSTTKLESTGIPICGSLVTRESTTVDKFNGAFEASFGMEQRLNNVKTSESNTHTTKQ